MTVEVTSNHPCLGCGYCCKVATCAVGLSYDHRLGQCGFLRWHDGRYWCGLIEDHIVRNDSLAIGAGCSSPLGNTDRAAMARQHRANGGTKAPGQE